MDRVRNEVNRHLNSLFLMCVCCCYISMNPSAVFVFLQKRTPYLSMLKVSVFEEVIVKFLVDILVSLSLFSVLDDFLSPLGPGLFLMVWWSRNRKKQDLERFPASKVKKNHCSVYDLLFLLLLSSSKPILYLIH